ncbi:MAG: hypothetical protein FWC23_03215 [Chitinispirillia bacterium]|nr:hypothetical protein [Chitinispirillia bacterium]MCL2268185.1 hypothetical protein [Chitinispirillia bacterium]
MITEEMVSRSPLRILEKSTQGGVGKGNIGIIAARKGVGKTACLVHIATDQLLQGKNIIHVSFAANTAHIISWYDDIYHEIARRFKLSGNTDIYDQVTRNRVIMNFKQGGVAITKILSSLKTMIKEGHFVADAVMVDGYDFSKSSQEEFSEFKQFAQDLQISLWFSATTHRDDPSKDEKGVPTVLSPYMNNTSILILMVPMQGYVHLNLVKDHDIFPSPDSLQLKLDPQVMLIAEEK